MRSTSLEICCTRSDIAQPCCGSSTSVCRMSRSKVPCGSSIRCVLDMSPFRFYRKNTRSLVEAQEEDQTAIVRKSVLAPISSRSEEHTSELQSLRHLVCRL